MQNPSGLLLSGWWERSKFYPEISKELSLGELLELRYVFERQIMSNLWNAKYTLKRENLT